MVPDLMCRERPATRSRRCSSRLIAWLGLVVAMTGCQSADEPEPGNLTVPAAEIAAAAGKTVAPTRMTMQEQVAWSIRDLAQRRGLPTDAITVFSASPVTWRSGAIGCPEPGMSYTDALVPGVSILLESGDELYHYHAGVGGEPFQCPRERAEPPVHIEKPGRAG